MGCFLGRYVVVFSTHIVREDNRDNFVIGEEVIII